MRLRSGWSLPVSVVVGLALLLAPAAPASAHDVSTGSDPRPGSVLSRAPEKVVMRFAERLSRVATQVEVTGPAGVRASRGEARVDGATLVQPLAPDLPAGEYTVVWHTASEDDHPVSGRFTFTVQGAVDAARPGAGPPAGPSTLTVAAAALAAVLAVALAALLAGVAPTRRAGRRGGGGPG